MTSTINRPGNQNNAHIYIVYLKKIHEIRKSLAINKAWSHFTTSHCRWLMSALPCEHDVNNFKILHTNSALIFHANVSQYPTQFCTMLNSRRTYIIRTPIKRKLILRLADGASSGEVYGLITCNKALRDYKLLEALKPIREAIASHNIEIKRTIYSQ